MPERIYKLQPDRTLALRGFDDLGAGAAVHSATANSFKVSGVFRDPADFAVLILYDADNYYEHPRLKYLPDTNFAGLTLTFDVHYSGLMPLDSPKFPSIDWPFLDVIRPDGTTAKIRLHDHAVQNGGTWTAAQTEFTIEDNGMKEFDRLTLWYQNIAFDYFVPKVECAYVFTAAGAGTVHSITVGGTLYSHSESAGESSADVAQALVNLLASSPLVGATRGADTIETGPPNQVNLRGKKDDGAAFTVSSTANATTFTLHGVAATTVVQAIAAQINSSDWNALGVLLGLSAEALGTNLRITSIRKGYDGNMLRMYAVSKNSRLRTTQETGVFTGGSSDATWTITIDFSERGIPDIRQMWLTFAPKLTDGAAYQDTEWEATFTNWALAGPEQSRMLQVAGPGSYRIEENEENCEYTGNWQIEYAFYSEGYARRATVAGEKVVIKYRSAVPHDLWLGTSLYRDRGSVGVTLDGDAETILDCYLNVDAAVNTRRRLRTSVAPNDHTLTIQLKVDKPVYFDFLEITIPSDVPDPLPDRPNLSPALDYSTDHTYKLSPARLMWIFDRLGFKAPMNEYIGVFWWNQRKRTGAVFPHVQVTFSGQFNSSDAVFLKIGDQPIGKSVLAGESPEVIARHFEYLINSTFVGVWAKASGSTLDIWTRSPKDTYYQAFDAWVQSAQGSTGAVAFTGNLDQGSAGRWEIDPLQTPALNRGARAWHEDFFRECHMRNREIVVASSMELVFPPDTFAARYPGGAPVETDVGFNQMRSTHCAFSSPMADYQKQVFADLAGMMSAAGLVPNLQCGEFTWWYFTNGGMAYHDQETSAAAQAALGRPLHNFSGPHSDPSVNSYADATLLRNRLRDYVWDLIAHVRAQYPNTVFEVLFPYDVNHPVPAGIHGVGGQLNRFVNLPVEWETKATAGFDRIKIEALDFGIWSRNLDLVETAIKLPIQLGWPRDSIRHITPIYRPGYAWEKEFRLAVANGISVINLWAFDHICIFGWPAEETNGLRRAVRMG